MKVIFKYWTDKYQLEVPKFFAFAKAISSYNPSQKDAYKNKNKEQKQFRKLPMLHKEKRDKISLYVTCVTYYIGL